MPEVTRTTTNVPFVAPGKKKATAQAGVAITRRVAMRQAGAQLELPTEPTMVSHQFSDYSVAMHGDPGIGKTDLAMVQEGVLLLTFDPPDKSMPWLQIHMKDWPTFLKWLAALEAKAASGEYPYPRVVVDGAEIMYRYDQNYIEDEELKVSHVSDADFGKGFDRVNGEYANAVDRLLALPGGCWFIMHSEWKMKKNRRGLDVERLVPLMKPKAEDQILGKCKLIVAFTYVGNERVLVIQGDEQTSAANKIKGHFLTPDGKPVCEVPAGKNAKEAWDNLQRAFENKQTFTHVGQGKINPNPNAIVKGFGRPKTIAAAPIQRGGNAPTAPTKTGGAKSFFKPRG